MEKNVIGQNIIKYRKSLGYSQKDLAEKTKLSRRAIAYYEREANNEIFDKLDMIAKALKLNIADLFQEDTADKTRNKIQELDTRILKRILQIKELPPRKQNAIWQYIDFITEEYNKNKKVYGKQK